MVRSTKSKNGFMNSSDISFLREHPLWGKSENEMLCFECCILYSLLDDICPHQRKQGNQYMSRDRPPCIREPCCNPNVTSLSSCAD